MGLGNLFENILSLLKKVLGAIYGFLLTAQPPRNLEDNLLQPIFESALEEANALTRPLVVVFEDEQAMYPEVPSSGNEAMNETVGTDRGLQSSEPVDRPSRERERRLRTRSFQVSSSVLASVATLPLKLVSEYSEIEASRQPLVILVLLPVAFPPRIANGIRATLTQPPVELTRPLRFPPSLSEHAATDLFEQMQKKFFSSPSNYFSLRMLSKVNLLQTYQIIVENGSVDTDSINGELSEAVLMANELLEPLRTRRAAADIERVEAQRLRESQAQEFRESLQADREKERIRKEELHIANQLEIQRIKELEGKTEQLRNQQRIEQQRIQSIKEMSQRIIKPIDNLQLLLNQDQDQISRISIRLTNSSKTRFLLSAHKTTTVSQLNNAVRIYPFLVKFSPPYYLNQDHVFVSIAAATATATASNGSTISIPEKFKLASQIKISSDLAPMAQDPTLEQAQLFPSAALHILRITHEQQI